MKKITAIFLIIGVLVVSAYVLVRQSLTTPGFTPTPPKDTVASAKPKESFLDLKPKLIEKLQQLIKQGCNGLYNLSIRELKPDILNSTLSISNALLVPDTAAMKVLEGQGKLPGEVFRIKTDSIWIDGLGIKDIISKEVVDVKSIHILKPTIDIYSNVTKQAKGNDGEKTLYQRLMSQMKHIGIGNIIIQDAALIHHNSKNNKSTKFNDIAMHLSDIVIDSTTQFDRKRFLFAKEAALTMKNYAVPTSNNLYTFKVGVISIKAAKQSMVASNVTLQPHYSKSEFQQHVSTQKERYEISIPSIEFRNTDWWSLINSETLQAKSAQISKANVQVYLDRRKPSGETNMKGFPHQLIMQLPMKLNIEKLVVNDLDITYEEFSKLSGKAGKVIIENMQGSISNLTNLPQIIKQNKTTTVSASGMFMKLAPVQLTLRFDLSNYKTGNYSAALKTAKAFDGSLVNPIAEPLGLFRIKRGELKSLVANIRGDNYKSSGDILMLYDDLHITPMKKDADHPGELKKKTVTSFIANTFVLKDENPSKDGSVRKVNASFTRKSGTFFNGVWKTIFIGILKTIGAPEKLAYQ